MLSPVNAELQSRFARSCADAAFGYARAASAAYAAMADQTLDFWATAAKRSSSSTPEASYYVQAPRRMAAPSIPMTPFDFFRMSNPWSNTSQAAFAPIAAWWGLAPFQTNPMSWPMAHAMMTAGVPRSVALPAAEANVAVLDAANAASASVTQVFSSYRSEGGFAMSPQVASPRNNPMLAAFFMPFGAAALAAPWFLSTGSSF
jgi:hypothetical protein